MHYTAQRQNNHHFDITNERKELIGSMEYKGWLPGKAQIKTTENDVYELAPSTRRNAAAGITKNGVAYAELKYNLRRSMVLTMQNGKSFFFVKKEDNYTIVDEAQNEIGVVKSKFMWRKMRYNYEIDVRSRMLDKEARTAFPLIFTYCTQYVRVNAMQQYMKQDKVAQLLFGIGMYLGWRSL